jgi:hypothetical protein
MKRLFAVTAISLMFMGLIVGCDREVEKNKEKVLAEDRAIIKKQSEELLNTARSLGALLAEICALEEFRDENKHGETLKEFRVNMDNCIDKKIKENGATDKK